MGGKFPTRCAYRGRVISQINFVYILRNSIRPRKMYIVYNPSSERPLLKYLFQNRWIITVAHMFSKHIGVLLLW